MKFGVHAQVSFFAFRYCLYKILSGQDVTVCVLFSGMPVCRMLAAAEMHTIVPVAVFVDRDLSRNIPWFVSCLAPLLRLLLLLLRRRRLLLLILPLLLLLSYYYYYYHYKAIQIWQTMELIF